MHKNVQYNIIPYLVCNVDLLSILQMKTEIMGIEDLEKIVRRYIPSTPFTINTTTVYTCVYDARV